MARLCPKTRINSRIRKATGGITVNQKALTLIYLDYVLFLERILQKADENAEEVGEKSITKRNIDAVAHVSIYSVDFH